MAAQEAGGAVRAVGDAVGDVVVSPTDAVRARLGAAVGSVCGGSRKSG